MENSAVENCSGLSPSVGVRKIDHYNLNGSIDSRRDLETKARPRPDDNNTVTITVTVTYIKLLCCPLSFSAIVTLGSNCAACCLFIPM